MADIRTHIRPLLRLHVIPLDDHYGPGEPPSGYYWIVDNFGVYVLDENGAYTMQAV